MAANRMRRVKSVFAVCVLSCTMIAVEWVAPRTADAVVKLGLQTLPPARLLDTRAGGTTIDGVAAGDGATVGGVPTVVQVAGRGGVPAAGVASVVINVTVDNSANVAGATGYVTVFPTGAPMPTASSLNYPPGQIVANELIARLGSGGTISIVTQGSTHVIVDVVGWWQEASDSVVTLTPARLMDTRSGAPTIDGQFSGSGPTVADGSTALKVTERGGVPASAASVVVNVTAVNETASSGFLTVYPTGQPRPWTSSLNFVPGQIVANELIARVGTDGTISIYTQIGTHVVVDVVGYFYEVGEMAMRTITPARVFDSRPGEPTSYGPSNSDGPFVGGTVYNFYFPGVTGVPEFNVGAAVINVTVISDSAGYVKVWSGSAEPNASSLNTLPGRAVVNELVIGPSLISFKTQATAHVIIDIVGWFPVNGMGVQPPDPYATTIQIVYVYALDGTPVAGRPAEIAHEVETMQRWFDEQTGGRHPMFAMDGSKVSVITDQLSQTATNMNFPETPEWSIMAGIRYHLPPDRANLPLVVVYEGMAATDHCGATGVLTFIATGTCSNEPELGSTFSTGMARELAHQLIHMMGAVGACAPHGTVAVDAWPIWGAHVGDDPRDLMYDGPLPPDLANLMLDPGHDDYFQHDNRGCRDIADNALMGTG